MNSIQEMRLQKLRKADPISYNKTICYQIRDKSEEKKLPTLTRKDFQELKKHLTEYKITKTEDLNQKFLQLRNAFLIINELEENPKNKQLIEPIIKFLRIYEPIFQQIQDPKTPQTITDTTNKILNFEINLFNIKYHHLIQDSEINTNNYEPIPIKTDEQEEQQ